MTVADNSLQRALQVLDVPEDFNAYETTDDSELVVRLEQWRQKAYGVLAELRQQLQDREELALEEKVAVVAAVAQFSGGGAWATESTHALAEETLKPYANGDVQLVEAILNECVRPIFRSNLHPKVNASTGRVLPRSAGGTSAYQDHYEGQVWKRHPGVLNVIDWCVTCIEGTAYERIWHLVIPPIMTLLDDYETKYKLRGVQIVSHLLENAPGELLRRTGIGGLFYSSFKTCLTFLRTAETPALIRSVVPASLLLVEKTTLPASTERFDQLWGVLGEGIIDTVWTYGFEEAESVRATLDVLPDVIRALGIGCSRYLKALVLQLVHPLVPGPENPDTAFQLASVCALVVLMEECAPRMQKWKGTILDGVCRRWVNLVESGVADEYDARALKKALRDTCEVLARVCPSVAKEEYCRLLELDEQMFRPLVALGADEA
ncbi:hypothetical protein PHLGIDRAFT_34198 [Phlebiopsis gigantea 11061_1 CR5-6]|uniref:Uncharacterized protein n=1 Tax=Phlebiopsis gigantea (strain 11061_1 CR5-6) TaxID=745531 RepID=A0A0C3SDP3_PHLG1|nr:hypothetical protein PHLGIDRAFT_34198 [Phlebiopsis gigantea 11061_1 CR5-6]